MKDPTISKTSKAIAALALALPLTAGVASAQSYPPASVLAAKWWQWVMETPASENPLTDTTGAFAAVNQPHGNVWFLAGNFGGTTVRTITIPAGKALFFPVANVFDFEDGIVVPGGDKVFLVKQPVQTAQGIVSAIISTAYGLSCTVDGNPVSITAANLEQSNPFSIRLPADNLFGFLPAGLYFPAVDSGYYVLLGPLPAGSHTIHFTGCEAAFSFCLDVTYNITVQ